MFVSAVTNKNGFIRDGTHADELTSFPVGMKCIEGSLKEAVMNAVISVVSTQDLGSIYLLEG